MSIAVSSFPSENLSRIQRFFYFFGRRPAPIQSVLDRLAQLNGPASDIDRLLLESTVCILRYSDKKIEALLRRKLQELPTARLSSVFSRLTYLSLDEGREKLLDVIDRIVDLNQLRTIRDTECPSVERCDSRLRMAGAIVLNFPLKQEDETKKKKSILSKWVSSLGNLRSAPSYLFCTLSLAYGMDLHDRPTSRWMAQAQVTFLRTALGDVAWLRSSYLQLFATAKKAMWVALGIIAAVAALAFLFFHFNLADSSFVRSLKMAPTVDKALYEDLTDKARQGLLLPSFGRDDLIQGIENSLSTPRGVDPVPVILRGPPGCGKSQLMEGLACRIANRKTAHLNDKKVIMVNSSDLLEFGKWSERGGYTTRIEELFAQIDGEEDSFIIFFDEGHNLSKKKEDENTKSTIETLKTKLLQKKIRCVFATSDQEFAEYFQHQTAFLSRSEVKHVPTLDDGSTKKLLRVIARTDEPGPILVTMGALNRIVELTSASPEANPRKSVHMLSNLMQEVYAWRPKEPPMLTELRNIKGTELSKYHEEEFKNNKYGYLPEGRQQLAKLDWLNSQIAILENFQQKIEMSSLRIQELSSLKYRFYHEKQILLQQRAKRDTPETEKRCLFFEFFVLPQLQKCINENCIKYSTDELSLDQRLREFGIAPEKLKVKPPQIPLSVDERFLVGRVYQSSLYDSERAVPTSPSQTIPLPNPGRTSRTYISGPPPPGTSPQGTLVQPANPTIPAILSSPSNLSDLGNPTPQDSDRGVLLRSRSVNLRASLKNAASNPEASTSNEQ